MTVKRGAGYYVRALRRFCDANAPAWFLVEIFLDCHFATIVATFATYVVIHVPCSTVRADCQRRDQGFVVCTTFCGTRMRLSAFRMCHCYLFSLIVIISVYCFFYQSSSSSSTSSTPCSRSISSICELQCPGACTF